jgi:Ca2+-transporting ATPase
MTGTSGNSADRNGIASAWAVETADIVSSVGVDPSVGLTAVEAARRLAEDGANELDTVASKPAWRLFLDQFANTMIIVLLVALVMTAVIGDLKDALVIAAVVVLNAIVGFVQEHRAERAMAALRRMTSPQARVRRDGTTVLVAASDVVVGDIVDLDAGDLVVADGRLLEAPSLRINEASLTGESVPADKVIEAIGEADGSLVGDRRNMAFRGTAVTYGRGLMVVTATGMRTELGGVAALLQAHTSPPTPLQRQLNSLGAKIAYGAVAICVLVFAIGIARGEPITLMFLMAVSLAVAAIPESMPAIVTVSMALGANRLVKRHALIRKLSAVETLGCVTVVASDKTGTLTEGRMAVERVWIADAWLTATGSGYDPKGDIRGETGAADPVPGGPLGRLLEAGALCNDAALLPPQAEVTSWEIAGDPTEGALLALAARGGMDLAAAQAANPRVAEVAFDADRKRMATFHRTPSGGALVAVKGALEAVMEGVTRVAEGTGDRPITDADRTRAREAAEGAAADGYRVIAVAGRLADTEVTDLEAGARDLVLYGFVAMADPPRAESAAAVEAARAAGITPIMITGDHPATAQAIATRLGIMRDGARLMTGTELAAEGPEHLARSVEEVAVYARTSPAQKLDIVAAWQARGAVVAMTGDGVNDAPALRRADIGVAMGASGTEVSREAADMVLADDNFATILDAVREGRRIYDNIRRSVRFGLTGGSAEIWLILLAPFLGLPLPLLPIQLLWVNLVTHGLPGVALATEPAEPDVMQRRPRPSNEGILSAGVWQHILADGMVLGAICLAVGLWGFSTDRPWQTMVFTSLALLQLGNALALRSDRRSVFSLGWRGNPFLLVVLVGTLALQLVLIYWAPAQSILSTEALSAGDLAVVLVASTSLFWIVEAKKLIRRLRERGAGDGRGTAATLTRELGATPR